MQHGVSHFVQVMAFTDHGYKIAHDNLSASYYCVLLSMCGCVLLAIMKKILVDLLASKTSQLLRKATATVKTAGRIRSPSCLDSDELR